MPIAIYQYDLIQPRAANCSATSGDLAPTLIRRVMLDNQLHNTDQWAKFGPIWTRGPFLRMVNILERGVDLGARHAVNSSASPGATGAWSSTKAPAAISPRPTSSAHITTSPSPAPRR